jgi:hypothetical protein
MEYLEAESRGSADGSHIARSSLLAWFGDARQAMKVREFVTFGRARMG